MRMLVRKDNSKYLLRRYNNRDKGLSAYLFRVAPVLGLEVKWVTDDEEEIKDVMEFENLEDIADLIFL